jgi:hypothetical protein
MAQQQFSMTLEQVKATQALYREKVKTLSAALDVNIRDGKYLMEAYKALKACVPVSMSNIGPAVTAIADGMATLILCQTDQMKLIVTGIEADKKAMEEQLQALEKAASGLASGLVIPGGSGIRQ